jgi:hypothetical protein
VPFSEHDDMVKTVGSSRSAVPHGHSAMASAARLVGHECPWHEAADENLAIDPVAIADNVTSVPFLAAGLGKLPGNPLGAGVSRHAEP